MNELANQLAAYGDNPNVRHFLDTVIPGAEGTDKNGYYTAFGGGRLEALNDHPRYLKPFTQTDGKVNQTSAAGKYQFLSGTWDDASKKLGLEDFGEKNQDLAALYLLHQNGSLPNLMDGDFQGAINKSGKTWASLPSSPYAQNKRSAGFIEGLVNKMVPTAQAGTLPNARASYTGTNMNPLMQPQIDINIDQAPMLRNSRAAWAGNSIMSMLPSEGNFKSQDVNQIDPNVMQALLQGRQQKAKLLPLAMGASMSDDEGFRGMGSRMLPEAMEIFDPVKLKNGMVLQNGKYVTDQDESSMIKALSSAQTAQNKEAGAKPSDGMLNKFNEEIGAYNTMSGLSSGFKDNYAASVPFDAVGNIENTIGNKLGVGFKEQGDWWRRYQEFVNEVRHGKFGASLTPNEKAEFGKQIVSVGMNPNVIREYVQRQENIMHSAIARKEQMARSSGYNTRGMREVMPDAPQGSGQVGNAPQMGGGSQPTSQRSDSDILKQYGIR